MSTSSPQLQTNLAWLLMKSKSNLVQSIIHHPATPFAVMSAVDCNLVASCSISGETHNPLKDRLSGIAYNQTLKPQPTLPMAISGCRQPSQYRLHDLVLGKTASSFGTLHDIHVGLVRVLYVRKTQGSTAVLITGELFC